MFPSLDTLKLSAINIQNIWHDSISACFWVQNLTDLSVEDCQSLHHIMPTAIATSFVKLKHLKICGCDMVEMIIFPTPSATHTSFSEEVCLCVYFHLKFDPKACFFKIQLYCVGHIP